MLYIKRDFFNQMGKEYAFQNFVFHSQLYS